MTALRVFGRWVWYAFGYLWIIALVVFSEQDSAGSTETGDGSGKSIVLSVAGSATGCGGLLLWSLHHGGYWPEGHWLIAAYLLCAISIGLTVFAIRSIYEDIRKGIPR